MAKHRFWHSRGYLPHLDAPELIQAVTFRAADAMPQRLIDRWKQELRQDAARAKKLHQRIARYEDEGFGRCDLAKPECAHIVQETLLHFDQERYRLLEWCVMPNHVHVILRCETGFPLAEVMKSWKAFTSRKINEFLGRMGGFWQREYYDRYMRDLDHLETARSYVRMNPVKAGLCAKPEDWPWGSAGYG
ncbi:MAG: transposase [Luteolibacter sp.]